MPIFPTEVPMPSDSRTAAPADNLSQGAVRAVLAAVAVTLLLATLGQTIVTPALPVIVADLGGLDRITWVITAYLLASTIAAPIFGKLGDLFGRKAVLQAGIAIFLVGSVVAGLAGSMPVLVAGRTIQGLGGGGLIVVCMATVADVLPARERGRAQGLLGAVFGVSTVIGPLLGGFLVQHLSWHWIFMVNLPLGAAALLVLGLGLRAQPAGRRPSIDYAGAVLLTLFLSATVLVANLGGTVLDWGAPTLAGLVAFALAALAGFVAVQARAAEPILPLPLFRNNTFVVINGVGFLVGMAMFGTITFVPLFLQVVKGATPTESGLFLLPMMAGLIGASTLSGQMMSRTGRYRALPIASNLLLAVAMVLLATVGAQTPLWLMAVYMLLAGMGLGPNMSIGVAAIQNAVPLQMLGVGTASANMFRLIGGAIGTAGFGALFAAGLHRNVGALLPEGSGTGLGSISGAAVAAMPPEVRAAVLDGFAQAMNPVFAASAVAALAAAALSLALRERVLAHGIRRHGAA
jgi:EmrB/QacA subfamily drug resistance transporter